MEKQLLTPPKTLRERGTRHPKPCSCWTSCVGFSLGELFWGGGGFPTALCHLFICKFLTLNFIPTQGSGGWRKPSRIFFLGDSYTCSIFHFLGLRASYFSCQRCKKELPKIAMKNSWNNTEPASPRSACS